MASESAGLLPELSSPITSVGAEATQSTAETPTESAANVGSVNPIRKHEIEAMIKKRGYICFPIFMQALVNWPEPEKHLAAFGVRRLLSVQHGTFDYCS